MSDNDWKNEVREHLARIFEAQDETTKTLRAQHELNQKQQQLLDEHARRSTASETRIGVLESFVEDVQQLMLEGRGAMRVVKWVAGATGAAVFAFVGFIGPERFIKILKALANALGS